MRELIAVLLGPILTLALTIHPIFAGNNDSPESSAEIIELLKEANPLWLKGDAQHGIPKYESLLPQIERAFGKDSPTVGLALFRIGFLYSARGDHERAVSNLEKSLKLVSSLPDNAENLVTKEDLYWGLGTNYKSLFQNERAIEALNEALRLKEKLVGTDDSSLVQLLSMIADLQSLQGRSIDAIPRLERALAISEKKFGKESHEAATALASLGNTRLQAGEVGPALACLKRSLQICKTILPPTNPDVGIATLNLGSLYGHIGDYGQAMPLLERAVALLEKSYGPDDATSAFQFARALNNLGKAHLDIGEYDKAIATLQRSLAVTEAAFGSAAITLVAPLNSIAVAYSKRGDFERAQTSYERALRVLEGAPSAKNGERVNTLNNLAQMLLDEGEEDAALKLFIQARALGESQLGATALPLAYSLNGLALINQNRGKIADALALFERSLAILENKLGPSHPDVAGTLTNISHLVLGTGDMDRALSTLEKALAIEEKALPPTHPYIATTLFDLAMLSFKQGKLIEAENLLQKSIAITDAAIGPDNPQSCAWLGNLGTVEIKKGDVSSDKWSVSKGLGEFVESTKRWRRYLAGQTVFQQGPSASQIQEIIQFSRNLFHSMCTVAPPSFAQSASLAGAEQLAFGKALLEEVETVRARLTADGRIQVQSLRQQADAVRKRLEAIPKQEGAAWLQQRTDWQNSERDKLERELKAIQEKLASASGLVSQTISESKLSLAEIARRLPPSAALIDFVQYQRMDVTAGNQPREQRYAAYLTFPLVGGSANVVVERVDLGEAAPIDDAVGLIAKRFAAGQYRAKDLSPAFQRLSDLVYVPLAKHLTNVSHLIICPDGQLSRIPFEMLPVGNKFLLEEKTISYVTSAREIIRLGAAQLKPKSGPQTHKSLVMGNPDFDLDLAKESSPNSAVQLAGTTATSRSFSRDYNGLKFNPLQSAEAEALSVAKLLGNDTVLRLGTEAREATLKTVQSPRVLHLATHGFFLSDQELKQASPTSFNSGFERLDAPRGRTPNDWENPLTRCGIALAGANHAKQISNAIADDGVLTGLEASLLDLQGTELVVLSTCDSGSGEVKIGEGVMSLCRAFRIAGAETVLASHWKVSDKATNALMTEFIRRWRAGEERAHAWCEAQLTLLHSKDFSDPFFWSAFTLTGEWR
jgi:CHAT domain-containing protein/Tfp pilus assembly protein PilF